MRSQEQPELYNSFFLLKKKYSDTEYHNLRAPFAYQCRNNFQDSEYFCLQAFYLLPFFSTLSFITLE